ncbi:transposase, partial [Streptosporangium canum]|uniref:IS110 family transposase n=1 Tax=Streptosporangium canum TaxID=324952 RepID=UPI003789DAE4
MLYLGGDWSEDYHDVEIQVGAGHRLVTVKLPEGAAGVARLHALIAEHLDPDDEADQVLIGIETDRGPWMRALVAAGYSVYAINPLQVARYRERTRISGAKSDKVDAHTMADMVRLDARQLRPVAADSGQAEAIKV